MNIKPETLIDGYKVDHRRQYPTNTEIIFSNLTARSTRREVGGHVVPFGLQYFVKEYLIKQWNDNFFSKPIDEIEKRFTNRINNYLGPNKVGFEHIRALYNLGYLPISIWALPEGSVVPLKVPCMVIFNTLPEFGWITNYFETILSTTVWGPTTSATTAYEYKKLFVKFANETVGNLDFVNWQGHDFSFRGMFGLEAACMSGAGHLLSFTGTDTIPAIDFLEQYYNADAVNELIGGSVAATEHSVMCAGGADDEIGTYRRLINDIYPEGIVSIVSDTWDYWNVLTNTARTLKDEIMARNGKVVFRPDTGDPVKVVCGYKWRVVTDWYDVDFFTAFEDGYEVVAEKREGILHYYKCEVTGYTNKLIEISESEVKGSIECLWDIFGGTITEKGYRQLDSHVGLIYGDSITLDRAKRICEGLAAKGFASTNLVYGIGSYTYQYVTRDTDGFAVKATFARIAGVDKEIFKNPKTDDTNSKKSAKGLTAVFKNENGEFYLKDQATWDEVKNCEFLEIFTDGKLLIDWSLAQIRDTLQKSII